MLDKDVIDRDIIQSAGYVNVQIMGNYISMLLWNVVVNEGMAGDYMQMWDWKSKNGYQVNQTTVTS